MVPVNTPRHICHIVSSLSDHAQNDLVFANIRQFPRPHFEHTLVVLKKSNLPPVRLPRQVSCLELTLKGSQLRKMRDCRKALLALKPDVCQTYGDEALPVQWLANRLDIPLKLHVHIGRDETLSPFRQIYHQWKYRFFSHSADVVIASDRETLYWLEDTFDMVQGKAMLIRTGINSRRLCPPLREVGAEGANHFMGTVHIPAQRFVVGLPIQSQDKTRVLDFLNEFHEACTQSTLFASKCLLLVLGNSPHLHEYRQTLDSLGISENHVRYCCQLSDDKSGYQHLDAIVSLNPKSPLSVQLLEAMSMGVPVMSPRDLELECIEGHPLHWPTDNIPPTLRQQLLTLFLDGQRSSQLGQAARMYVMQKHNHQEHQRRYRALYDSLSQRSDSTPTEPSHSKLPPSKLNH